MNKYVTKKWISVLQLFLWYSEETADVEVGETLDEALARINADINTLPQLTSFPYGNTLIPVCVQTQNAFKQVTSLKCMTVASPLIQMFRFWPDI